MLLSPDESWLPIASIVFCIIHVQVKIYQILGALWIKGSYAQNFLFSLLSGKA